MFLKSRKHRTEIRPNFSLFLALTLRNPQNALLPVLTSQGRKALNEGTLIGTVSNFTVNNTFFFATIDNVFY
jgi:hypothetical protein